jgi:hypothetical protein
MYPSALVYDVELCANLVKLPLVARQCISRYCIDDSSTVWEGRTNG